MILLTHVSKTAFMNGEINTRIQGSVRSMATSYKVIKIKGPTHN